MKRKREHYENVAKAVKKENDEKERVRTKSMQLNETSLASISSSGVAIAKSISQIANTSAAIANFNIFGVCPSETLPGAVSASTALLSMTLQLSRQKFLGVNFSLRFKRRLKLRTMSLS